MTVIYALFAIFGLGVLVFIHELGHYFIAIREGMRVEAFAIGFGRPLISWMRNGVKWQICMLPFGGYVKIAGMQKENGKEPSEITDGFYGKGPMARIKVAIAGPLVNIVFALLVFTALWMTGGREKQFSEFTKHIGWVDPKSELYANGVRPGDLIVTYDGHPFNGFKDLLMASIMKGETTEISGEHFDFTSGSKEPFQYTLKTYSNPDFTGKDKLGTIGVLQPARFLLADETNMLPNSPMVGSGLQNGDRLLWANGEVLFSQQQLSSLLNEETSFLTVEREGTVVQVRVPRVKLSDLRLSMPERGEIDDWQHEAGLKGKLTDLYFIPYNLSPTLDVEGTLAFIDEEEVHLGGLLQEGDHILAVDGKSVATPEEMLSAVQTRNVVIVVQRAEFGLVPTATAENELVGFSAKDLRTITSGIGREGKTDVGNLHLLKPVEPKPLLADRGYTKAILGIGLHDLEVLYNPTPFTQFKDVFKDTYRTLTGLLTGAANPKYVAGPVGIVQIVHQSWAHGAKEAFFWMALISLNLGIVNLLPLPVLDGGHILFSLIEMVRRKPLSAKTMEILVIPFVALLIGFFIFVTYNDISRLFGRFF